MSNVRLVFNKCFREVNQCRRRYRVLKGSAGSGKSVNVAQDYIVKLEDKNNKGANLLVIRKSEGTHRYSTFAELRAAILRIHGGRYEKYWKIITSPLTMICKATGNSIIFRGVNDEGQREKLKSISFPDGKLTWIWIEEATELREADIDILDDRLRGQLDNENLFYQITFTFNPVSALHWIKRKYFDIINSDIFTHHSTYLMNKFIDAAFHRRMDLRKKQDPEGYKVYGLGEWGETSGLILSNWTVEEFDRDPARFDSQVYGQDFGYNHANALLDVRFKDGELYIADELYVYEKTMDQVIAMANQRNYNKSKIMHCDSAETDRIKMWQVAGYNALGVVKDANCVPAQIDCLKRMKIRVYPSCVNTIKELSQWRWKKDEKTGLYTDSPVEVFDDAMAALRYSVEDIRRIPTISKPAKVRARSI